MLWALDLILIVLLGGSLWQAFRLERALGVLRRDRVALEQLVAGFNASTQQAEQSIERLRAAADGSGRQIGRQIDAANGLKDDLLFLMERGDRLADQLEALVRAGRGVVAQAPREPAEEAAPPARPDPDPPGLRSQAAIELARALRLGR